MDMPSATTFRSVCHSQFIVKDIGMEINWKKPLLQKCRINSKISICKYPFAEGAMRYAFLMKDLDINVQYVVKLPKDPSPVANNLEVMN